MSHNTTAKLQLMFKKKTFLSRLSVSLQDLILVSPDCYLEALETQQGKFATLSAK